ncbi:MAG: DUF5060 domain-containing protein [Lentimicrobium sp.]
MNRFIIEALLVVLSISVRAQIQKTELLQTKVNQYQKAEWSVVLKASWSNPYAFSEIALDMILTSPSGKHLALPCYYESGKSGDESVWKARFAARETGVYSYQFELKENGEIVSSTPKAEFSVNPSKGKGFLNPDDFWTLRYDNGELFRGIGENICWESRDEDDSKYFRALHEDKRFNYNYMLTKLAANGGNFFRTWMIYWNLPVDWKTVNNNSRYQNSSSPYNESGMKRMDQLVELCDSLGIHMMLALESHVGTMGLGWEISSYNVANGGFAKTPYEFFTLSDARQQYKNKLRLMVARYGYSPAIGAWEFFNEIDNAMYHGKPEDRIPDAVVTAWHDEMSTFLKNTDPYRHMVTTSISHRDVEGLNDLKNIDINQKHIYKNTAGIPGTIRQYTQKHNKPYVIGESGYEWDWSKNFNDFAADMDGDFKRALWYGLFSPTPVLPMSWWWEFFESRGMMGYFNQVSEINRSMLAAGGGQFESLDVKSLQDGVVAYAVKCGNRNFIYLYNASEVSESIQFSGISKLNTNNQVNCFDCETGNYSTLSFTVLPDKTMITDQLKLQPKGDVILIFD